MLRLMATAREVIPQDISIDIVYEDEDLLALNKPAGMVVQYALHSVENAIAFYLNNTTTNETYFNSSNWPWKTPLSFQGIVHRIDRGTSGLLLVAKHPLAARTLQQSFEKREVQKSYLAIAEGLPSHQGNASPRVNTDAATSQDNSHPRELDRLKPHQRSLSQTIKQCGRNVTQAEALLYAELDPSPSCVSAAISVCMRHGNARAEALTILNHFSTSSSQQPQRTVVVNLQCFKTAIALCARDDPPDWETAVQLVGRLGECNLPPYHPHCVSSAISACGRAKQIRPAMNLLKGYFRCRHSADPLERELVVKAAVRACERCYSKRSAGLLTRTLHTIMASEDTPGMSGSTGSKQTDTHTMQSSYASKLIVNSPIGKVGSREMGITSNNGREAITMVEPLAFNGTHSLNHVAIETGRTHQIRVHMALMLKSPLVGDGLYGSRHHHAGGGKRPMLHAFQLAVPHPCRTGSLLRLQCSPPADFLELSDSITDGRPLSEFDVLNQNIQ